MTDAVNQYDRDGIQFVSVYLKPGEMCVSAVPALVTTILGSCVAVTMYQPELGVSAICHAVQSSCPKQSTECLEDCIDKYRYVSCVIPEMLGHMEAVGAEREAIEVKLFGGAAMLSMSAKQTIGRQNIATALSVIKRCRLDLTAHQVGGRRGRKIIFNTYTGEVTLKRIRHAERLLAMTNKKQGRGARKR